MCFVSFPSGEVTSARFFVGALLRPCLVQAQCTMRLVLKNVNSLSLGRCAVVYNDCFSSQCNMFGFMLVIFSNVVFDSYFIADINILLHKIVVCSG